MTAGLLTLPCGSTDWREGFKVEEEEDEDVNERVVEFDGFGLQSGTQ